MLNFAYSKKLIYLILGIAVVMKFINYGTEGILQVLLTVPGVLIALTFHEFAHAYIAYKLGDDTAKAEGRVSLNPIKHVDPIGFLMLLAVGFGWGRPVQINPSNFNRNISMKKAEARVAAAGPVMNFIIAFILLIIYQIFFIATDWYTIMPSNILTIVYYILTYTILINIGLGVFNLIPLPPLDGSKILENFLSYNSREWFERNTQIFSLIFIVMIITGVFSNIISPIISLVSSGMGWLASAIVGIFI